MWIGKANTGCDGYVECTPAEPPMTRPERIGCMIRLPYGEYRKPDPPSTTRNSYVPGVPAGVSNRLQSFSPVQPKSPGSPPLGSHRADGVPGNGSFSALVCRAEEVPDATPFGRTLMKKMCWLLAGLFIGLLPAQATAQEAIQLESASVDERVAPGERLETTTSALAGDVAAVADRSLRDEVARSEGIERTEASLWSKLGGGVRGLFTSAATGTIRGRVVDAATQQPLSAVQVYVSGTAFNALTDESGLYQITGVPAGLYSVEARRIGYANATRENVSVPDGGTVTVDFSMSVTALMLDEIVATGVADPMSARRVPFTVARVNETALQVPSDNAVNALQGKVAGVSIVTSPQPGAGINMVLRSPTSINKTNSPLIVVDGVILASTFSRSSADLESLDIESIEVVKGAAAASLYGSRAANGVIQIRTKRGTHLEEGKTRVTVRSEYGQNSLARTISRAKHHHYLINEAGEWVDSLGVVVPREKRVERPAHERFVDQPFPGKIYDHIEQFFDPGSYASHSISIAQNGAFDELPRVVHEAAR